ncbi:hypothetical protein N657DRAFT_440384 [Parathielavia appendiculata]|uniref:Uncharacterized protein n=1 Tax=Parathielavia appendiculata TaxID=2587402 RepID=A0AAN6U0A3_9PEZI|nr:hypothetical protein N657DRAFT_440384 [Parathielavia appendiculata]
MLSTVRGFRCTNLSATRALLLSQPGPPSQRSRACALGPNFSVGELTVPNVIIITPSATGAPAPVQTETLPVTLYAPMFQLNYRSSDLAALSPSTSTSSRATTGSTSALSINSDAATDSSSASAPAASAPGSSSQRCPLQRHLASRWAQHLEASCLPPWWHGSGSKGGDSELRIRSSRLALVVGVTTIPTQDTIKQYTEHGWGTSELEASHGLAPSELTAGTPRLNPGYIDPKSAAELG